MIIAIASLFALSALLGQGDSYTVADCPAGLDKNDYVAVYEDWCFEFNYERRNDYDDANKDCSYYGGSLALVKTKDIQTFLFEKIQDLVFDHGEDIEPLWIGLNDKDVEGSFVWEDGTNVTYTNWGKNEGPGHQSANTQDCAAIGTYEGLWVDEHCETGFFEWGEPGRPYICQYDVVQSSGEPSDTTVATPVSSAR